MSEIKITKRNLITGILVLVVVVFVWQIYELFWGDDLPQDINRPQAVATTPEKPMATTILPATAVAAGAQATNAVSAPGQLPPPPVNIASDDNSNAALDPNSDAQAQYLKLVNQYQMAQLQRMIAEDNEAIAVARRNAAQAMSDTTKLAGDGSVPISATSDSSGVSGYELVYTGQQNDGSWTATLKKDGQTYDVDGGKLLPDGSQVISVDENGVLISQNNGAVKKLVTFSGEVVLGAPGSASSSNVGDDQSLVKSTPPEDTDSIVATKPALPDDSDSASVQQPNNAVNAANSNDQDTDAQAITAIPSVVSAQAKPSNTLAAQISGTSVAPQVTAKPVQQPVAPKVVPTTNLTAVKATPTNTTNVVQASATAPNNSVKLATLEKKMGSDDQSTSVFSKLSEMMQTDEVQPTKSTVAIASVISSAPKTMVAVNTTAQTTPEKPAVVSADPAILTSAVKTVATPVKPVVATNVVPAKPVATPVKPAIATTPAPTAPVAKTVEADANKNSPAPAGTVSETAILAENPNHFTIQLTTDHELASVLDFINRNHLQGQATYFQAYNRHGEKLYVLVQGHFASQEEALQAIDRLPSHVREEGAFAQSYAAIQGMVRRG